MTSKIIQNDVRIENLSNLGGFFDVLLVLIYANVINTSNFKNPIYHKWKQGFEV